MIPLVGLLPSPVPPQDIPTQPEQKTKAESLTGAKTRTFHIAGDVPPEIWNRLGTKVLPKLRNGSDLKIGIEFSVTIDSQLASGFENDLKQILEDLGVSGRVKIE